MAKTPTPAQLAARERFAAMARAGAFKKRRKNPDYPGRMSVDAHGIVGVSPDAPVRSVEGQKNLASRGSRIASLMAMNEQIRKLDPTEAWHPDNITDSNDLDGLQDRISETLVRLQREKAPAAPAKSLDESRRDATLDREVSDNGERMTRRQWVERKVAEGLKTKVTQEDRIKPMSRMQFFRANNEEQRAHEKKIKEAGKKDVFWIGDYEVTKTEHDYAVSLADQLAAEFIRRANPLTRVKVKSPSMATGAPPSKRLTKRRKATAKAPQGYYANPVKFQHSVHAADRMDNVVQARHGRAWSDVARFVDFNTAKQYAQAYADAHNVQVKVLGNFGDKYKKARA